MNLSKQQEQHLYKTIGGKIRHKRLTNKLTLTDVARSLQMSHVDLGEIERGVKKTSIVQLTNIANYFGVTIHEFL